MGMQDLRVEALQAHLGPASSMTEEVTVLGTVPLVASPSIMQPAPLDHTLGR